MASLLVSICRFFFLSPFPCLFLVSPCFTLSSSLVITFYNSHAAPAVQALGTDHPYCEPRFTFAINDVWRPAPSMTSASQEKARKKWMFRCSCFVLPRVAGVAGQHDIVFRSCFRARMKIDKECESMKTVGRSIRQA